MCGHGASLAVDKPGPLLCAQCCVGKALTPSDWCPLILVPRKLLYVLYPYTFVSMFKVFAGFTSAYLTCNNVQKSCLC